MDRDRLDFGNGKTGPLFRALSFLMIFGDDGVAAFSIARFLFPVVFSIADAVAQSAQPIISFNYGAHQPGRILSVITAHYLLSRRRAVR